MKIRLTSIIILALVFSGVAYSPNFVSADEKTGSIFDPSNFSATLMLTTNYIFRGISQTDDNPAVQGSIDYSHPIGFYAGIWGSNVNSSVSKGGVEFDFYGGYKHKIFSDLGLDLSIIYYSYPGGGNDPNPNYFEGHIGLDYQFKNLPLMPTIAAAYYYSPDFFGEDGSANYINGTLSLNLPYEFTLSGSVGYQTVAGDKTTGNGQGLNGDDGFDYTNWRIGISKEILNFLLDLSWTDTNETDFLGDDIAGSHIVFSVSRTF
jgi:uncharacterized protein (TIGR02001 family)